MHGAFVKAIKRALLGGIIAVLVVLLFDMMRPAPIDADVMDRIMASKRAKEVGDNPPPQPSEAELRKQYGTEDDDELILKALIPQPDIDAMRAAGAFGARLTGAGFGGYALAAAPRASAQAVLAAAEATTGGPAFAVKASGGVEAMRC